MTDQPPNGRGNNRESTRPPEEMAAAAHAPTDHMARAAARMAELRAIHGDLDDFSEIYVDPWYAAAPPGWDYNWKTWAVWGKEYPTYFAAMLRNGWSPVPAHRHRDMLYPDYVEENILKDGMILMERPAELTEKVKEREKRRAIDAVRMSELKLHEAPPGTAPRDANPRTIPQVRHSVGPAQIPT